MVQATRGVVLRIVKYSETSLICTVYTERFGMRSYIVGGVRSKKARIPVACLQPMHILDLWVYHRPSRSLNRLRDVQVAIPLRTIPMQPLKAMIGLFFVDLLFRCIREEEANSRLFQFVVQTLTGLDEMEAATERTIPELMLALSDLLGIRPLGRWSQQCCWFDLREATFVRTATGSTAYLEPPVAEIFSDFINGERIQWNPTELHQLIDAWVAYYATHIPGFRCPPSLRILQQVFVA